MVALDASLDALSGDRREALDLGELRCSRLRRRAGSPRQGDARCRLRARRRGAAPRHRSKPVRRLDAGQRRLALGQRAGLVDDERIDRGEALERRGIAHQHAGLRAAPGRHHDRDRRGEPERAGAGDDQHAHRRHQRVGELRRRSRTQPGDEGDHRDQRSPPARNSPTPCRQAPGSARASAAPSATMATTWASVVSAPVRSTRMSKLPVPFSVPPVTRSPASLLDRHRLAGQHQLIDGAAALDHGAVDRHLVAGPHAQHVADLDLGERHGLGLAVVQHAQRGLGREIEQGADGAAGPLAGAKLEHLADAARAPR